MGRTYDVVILGATGFTGQLASEYMARVYPIGKSNVRWALAARSKPKLQSLADRLGTEKPVDLLICDVTDLEALERVVASTSVVVNYAGTPFIDKALPVVELCAKLGTHYCDITGEIPLHRASYDQFHKAAKASGAIVLHGVGFDSVPSDIGAFLAAKAMRERHGCGSVRITGYLTDSSGGVSGGTIATVLDLIKKGVKVPGAKEASALGAYPLDPLGGVGGPDTRDFALPGYDSLGKMWTAPFVMAAVNGPVVRKSNALSSYSYGKGCKYNEVMGVPSLFSASILTLGLALFGLVLLLPPLRALCFALRLLPLPGEGPSRKQQEAGSFKLDVYAQGEKEGVVAKAHVHSGTAGDPGYKATALMSMECALALALQRDACAAEGGVLTTATALGEVLVARLNKAGMDIGIDAA